MKRIGLIGLAFVLVLSLLPVTLAAAADYGTVTGGWLRLRTAPSYDATIIKSYNTGTIVEILGTSGDWYSVMAPNNQAGYMHSDYISLGSSGATTKYVTSENDYGVRMRTGPSKGYRVLAVYSVGTKVSVLQTGAIWSRIQVGTTVGFMMSEFLTSTNPGSSPSTPEGDDMATVWSSNGYGVRLRSGSSTSDSIIGLYSVGTRVSVQTRGTDWDDVIIGSRRGYMMNEFLIYDDPDPTVVTSNTVTAFSFDQTAATVSIASGDVELRIGYTISGVDLSTPKFTLAVSSEAGGHVTATIDEAHEEIVLAVSSAITDGTEFTVTGTTTDDDAGGSPKTAVLTVTITDAAVTLTSLELVPADTSLRHDESANINARLHYSDGTYVNAAITTQYTLAITEGSTYASLSTKLLVPNAANLIGEADQTVEITGTSVEDSSLTDTCEVLLYGRNEPDAPTLTDTDAAFASVTLTWTEPADDGGDDLISFKAYYSLTEGGAKNLLSAAISASDTDYEATGLINGTTYYFWMVAVNAQGDSTYSNFLTAVPNATAPSAPLNLQATLRGDEFVKLEWDAPTDTGGSGVTIDHYRVYVDDGANPTYEFDAAGRSSALTKTVTGLTNGQTYTFLVLAVNDEDLLGPTDSVDENPVGTPDAPTIALVMDSNEQLYIQWTPGADDGGNAIQDYDVYIKVDGDPDPGSPTATISGTEYTFLGLTNGTEYEMWVTANNDYDDSADSNRETGIPMAP